MGIRTGHEYKERLLDDRQVWFRGQRIEDVTKHPAFSRKADTIASLFDARDAGSIEQVHCPSVGEDCRASFLVPRTRDDLARRKQWSEWTARETFGLLGRSPDFLQSAITSFASAAEYFAENRDDFPKNVDGLYQHAARNDLFLARATVGPAINRGKPYSQLDDPFTNVRVLRETDSGVILRGAKMISTNAALADELLVFPLSGLHEGDEDYALAFMIPISSSGLKIICRDAFDDGSRCDSDFPISSRFEESDSLCVFEDVHVPWERLFLYRNVAMANRMYGETNSRNFTGYQTLIRTCAKTELLTSVAIACAEINGCSRHLHVQEMLGEILAYHDVIRGLLLLADTTAFKSKWGVYCPDARPAQSARILYHKYSARMIEVIQTVAGGTLFGLPTTRDIESEIGKTVERAFQTEVEGWSPRQRIKLFRIAWELIGDGFGQRQQIYEKYHAGDPVRIAAAQFAQQDRDAIYSVVERVLKPEPVGEAEVETILHAMATND